MCATKAACEITGLAVAKVMSVDTVQFLWSCYNNNKGACGMLGFTAGRIYVNKVDPLSFIQFFFYL